MRRPREHSRIFEQLDVPEPTSGQLRFMAEAELALKRDGKIPRWVELRADEVLERLAGRV